MFDFSDSFFNKSHQSENLNTSDVTALLNKSTDSSSEDIFGDLRSVRNDHPKNLIFGHININSIRYKFDTLREILDKNDVDILVIEETKLDVTFSSALFQHEGYKMYRKDNRGNSGGWVPRDNLSRVILSRNFSI